MNLKMFIITKNVCDFQKCLWARKKNYKLKRFSWLWMFLIILEIFMDSKIVHKFFENVCNIQKCSLFKKSWIYKIFMN